MIVTPQLGQDRYSVLPVDDFTMDSFEYSIPDVPTPPPPLFSPLFNHPRRKRWERFAPCQYISSAATSRERTLLEVDIQLTTTDEGLHLRTRALIDSGATGSFIDSGFVAKHCLPTK